MEDERVEITAREVGSEKIDPANYLRFEGVRAKRKTYGPRKLDALWSIGSSFKKCNFVGLDIADAQFGSGQTRSRYVECTFDGSTLRAPAVGWARFERCSFRNVKLTDFNSAADFIDCVFTGAARHCKFHGVAEDVMTGAQLRSVEFHGNDFTGMELRDVVFRGGIDLRRQLLPDGPNDIYIQDAAEALRQARDLVRDWPDEQLRTDVLIDIDILQTEAENHHQEQLFVRADDLESDPQTRLMLIEALRPQS